MHSKKIIKQSIVFVITVVTVLSCGRNQNEGNKSKTTIGLSYEQRSLDIEQAKSFIRKRQGEILDVRSIAEYDQDHFDRAINIPYNPDSFAKLIKDKRLDKNTFILVHCAAGVTNGRSHNAIKVLDSLGFKKVYNLKGGYLHYKGIEEDYQVH